MAHFFSFPSMGPSLSAQVHRSVLTRTIRREHAIYSGASSLELSHCTPRCSGRETQHRARGNTAATGRNESFCADRPRRQEGAGQPPEGERVREEGADGWQWLCSRYCSRSSSSPAPRSRRPPRRPRPRLLRSSAPRRRGPFSRHRQRRSRHRRPL